MLILEPNSVSKKREVLNVNSTLSRLRVSPLQTSLIQPVKLDNFAIIENVIDMPCLIPVKTDYYAIVIAHEGSCRKVSGRFGFEITPRSLHFISPQSIHSYSDISPDMRLSMVLFRNDFIAGSYIKENLLDQLVELSPVIAPYFELNDERYRTFLRLFSAINDEIHAGRAFNIQFVKLMIVQMLYEMNRTCELCLLHSTRHLSRQHQLATAYRKLVDESFLEMKTVQEYADKLNVTSGHLAKVIKEETGVSALAIIHNRVHLEAQYLLTSSDMTIKQVSYHLGFDTSSHFGRFFKHYSGVNPSEYKLV